MEFCRLLFLLSLVVFICCHSVRYFSQFRPIRLSHVTSMDEADWMCNALKYIACGVLGYDVYCASDANALLRFNKPQLLKMKAASNKDVCITHSRAREPRPTHNHMYI